jgi:GTP-binding protein
VVDARDGVTPADRHYARWLHRLGRPVVVVANKAEGRSTRSSVLDAFELGFDEPIAVSAEHGEGISDLMAEIASRLPEATDEGTEPPRPLKLAIVGRPNAGKSTLVNRLVGEERMLTGPEPGLTRDAVSVMLSYGESTIELVDTAGLRRKARIEAPLEKLAVGAAIGALKLAEVVVLVVDATEGLHDQDLQIAQLIEREGRAGVLALNKWDAVVDRTKVRRAITDRLETSLAQSRGLPVVPLSASTGTGVDRLLPAVRRAHAVWNTRVPTAELNRWFEQALTRHPPPLMKGRRLKLRYVTQAKARPPTFVVFGTRAEQLPEDYQRYLVNSLRETFDLPGTPIRLQMRGTRNPYADR